MWQKQDGFAVAGLTVLLSGLQSANGQTRQTCQKTAE
jgi:hypothetical protein